MVGPAARVRSAEGRGWAIRAALTISRRRSVFHVHQVYTAARPIIPGAPRCRCCGPQDEEIVNNESSEIIRMLNTESTSSATRPRLTQPPCASRSTRSIASSTTTSITGSIAPDWPRTKGLTSRPSHLFAALDELGNASLPPTLARRRPFHPKPIWRYSRQLVRFDTVYYVCLSVNLCRLADYHIYQYTRNLRCQGGWTVDLIRSSSVITRHAHSTEGISAAWAALTSRAAPMARLAAC